MSSMPDVLLDENLSWRVARGLRENGYRVETTSEAQLTSQRDTDVFRYAQTHHLVVITRDDDFRTRFAPPHSGIIIIQVTRAARNADILACLLARLPQVFAQPLADSIQTIVC